MAYQFVVPDRTIIGEDSLKQSLPAIKAIGKKALIVTGKVVTKAGIVNVLTDLLEQEGISYEIFNEITSEPTDYMIEQGVMVYKDKECDFIIGIGGGSPLDSAKAIGAMSVLEGKISDYLGKEIEGDFPAMVLIPTTAGTGSEATKFTIITDSKRDVKMLLKGDALLPRLAVIDPSLSMSAPKSVTSATGMDALTHAVESYTSRKGNPITDIFALSAIKRIFTYLPIAYSNGEDKKAREELAIAAYEAGICINNASVTLIHGMSRPIGALFHVPHGVSNAMIIKEGLAFALDGCYDRFADIARTIGAAAYEEAEETAANAFLKVLEELCITVEIPTLREYGIDKEDFEKRIDKMAEDAMASGSPSNTIKKVKKDDLIQIYKKLWD
ncbi:iron-containing alcohol dehydrogenase [Kineothrix sedimenti]|uniref:Iron-containing alcohol dehydrogenase n=1 Tax=Kineothrix sedimenti TaxID=3123317 RepID=A0ABZ3EZW3_9FIRM